MAPVILSMDVHCHVCAKKIRKAAMKLPGVDSVTFGTGLVVIEGTADAAALRARLQAKTGKAVNVVSDGGVEGGEAASCGSVSVSGYASPPPPPPAPIILEMELQCRSCAKKVEKRLMQVPGVDMVTTDVGASQVEVTGTADASAVATSLQVRTRSSVRVVSDSRRLDFPAGYDEHEQRKAAAAAWAAAQQMYGEPPEAATDASGATAASVPLPAAPCCRRRRQRRARALAPSPPVQPAGSSNPPHPSPPLHTYVAPPPQAAAGAGYYYPAPGVYGGQYWAAAPSQPPVGFCTGQWPAYPPPEGYYPCQGGEVYGGQQMWAPFQQCENPHSCCVQ